MKSFFLFSMLLFCSAAGAAGQSRCLTSDEAKNIIASLQSPKPASANPNLRKEMLAMRAEREKLNAKIYENFEKNRNLIPEVNQMGERHFLRVCQIIRENGWLNEDALKQDGLAAFKFLIVTNKAFRFQRELFPVLVEAAKKKLFENYLLAQIVDTIRVNSGLPQIFGTEATIKDNVIYIYPLVSNEKVDEWRKTYGLRSLLAQIKNLEMQYMMPVLKMRYQARAANGGNQSNDKTGDAKALGISGDTDEVIAIDTKLVNLNVRLLPKDPKIPLPQNLTKEDFTVSEDGVEQEIAFFSNTEQPFDLILLLDFSGSTVDKRNLIKKAAQRFVERTRAADRVAVVAFTHEIEVVSDLSADKNAVTKKIKDIEMTGGSAIWDALSFIYRDIIEKESVGRRSAVVMMTDGADGSFNVSFADSIEKVKRGDTTIFPVYIDGNDNYSGRWTKLRQKHRQTLQMLADETGGQLYEADSARDLEGIYEQIVGDLGKVYSLGYEPKNENRDGGWRNLSVQIKTQPNLTVKTRRGYYGN